MEHPSVLTRVIRIALVAVFVAWIVWLLVYWVRATS
jgi:hypothetical protein